MRTPGASAGGSYHDGHACRFLYYPCRPILYLVQSDSLFTSSTKRDSWAIAQLPPPSLLENHLLPNAAQDELASSRRAS